MRLQTKRAQFLYDTLDLEEASGVEGARWEHFQLMYLQDDGIFRNENKARQIAWSFTIAAEAVANAVLDGVSSLFQSINLDEAREKIIYARVIYDNLKISGLPKIAQPDTTTVIGFDNGARIISSPGTPQRGKARFWVYLDEWAHQKHDRANYTAALPIISKGGKIRGASSPMGAGGMFWEVYTQSIRPYPGYTRKATPWWEIHSFCKDVAGALRHAPGLTTAERIERFGNDRIKMIFENMPIEDFTQEYECDFVDEVTAWFTWEEIKRNQVQDLVCLISEDRGSINNARFAIDQLAGLVNTKVERGFSAGFDVGRTRNTSELFIVGRTTTDTYPLRGAITLDNCEFDDQFEIIHYAMTRLPITQMLIDRNGIGRNLAENAEKAFPGKVQGVDFTNVSKSVWITDAKMLIQQNKTPLPIDRDISYQIHSIKKIVTPSKNVVFDTERSEKHHADKLWAWVLALAGSIVKTYQSGSL